MARWGWTVHGRRCGPRAGAWSTGPWWTGPVRGGGGRPGRGGAMAGFAASSLCGAAGLGRPRRGHGKDARDVARPMSASARAESGRGGGCARRGGSAAAALLRRGRARD